MMSVIAAPLSSSSTGTMQSGFRARNAGVDYSFGGAVRRYATMASRSAADTVA
jgi:hypothetical protein